MKSASSYAEWREFAQQLDKMGHPRGGDYSGKIRENLYDRKLLQQKLQHLQSTREKGNVKEMMFGLRTDLIRNIANIAKRCDNPAASDMSAPLQANSCPLQQLSAKIRQTLGSLLSPRPVSSTSVKLHLVSSADCKAGAFGQEAMLTAFD
eukprot:GHUV01024295.1.p1 GENE.GHUV01024295.1~~GHUV01024295.1.p1  ORF type:complete len:150 (+),score=49.66 GHUV01024295.1:1124-1573(+)